MRLKINLGTNLFLNCLENINRLYKFVTIKLNQMAKLNNLFNYQDKVFDKFLNSLFPITDKEEDKEEKPKPKPELPPIPWGKNDEEPPLFI